MHLLRFEVDMQMLFHTLYSLYVFVSVENPEAAFGDIARIISAKFKELNEKDKKKWEKKAAEDKERYARDMATYRGE